MNTNALASQLLTNDIRDIKPPVEIPSGWAWLGWVLAIVAVVAVLLLVWRWWRSRARTQPAPTLPAHVRARHKLQEALAMIDQPKPFCTLVSDTIRYYLEERFNFRAPERTTEEFLTDLQQTQLLTAEQKNSLGDFLSSCDLVKFARYEPGEIELRALHESALRLVDETTPTQVPNESATVASSETER